MITIKSVHDIECMKAAGKIVEDTLLLLERSVRIGITTGELNAIAEDYIRSQGAYPTCLNYNGFPKAICISVNEVVVHGIPGPRKIKDGDIVSCDVCATLNGFVGDAARTFCVGNVAEETRRLVQVTKECFFEGIRYARPGYRVCDISKAIQEYAESHGYGVVRELTGHGVGRQLHEDPGLEDIVEDIGQYGVEGSGILYFVWQLDDGWTITTRDGKPAAHYENSIAITDGKPILLTCSEEY